MVVPGNFILSASGLIACKREHSKLSKHAWSPSTISLEDGWDFGCWLKLPVKLMVKSGLKWPSPQEGTDKLPVAKNIKFDRSSTERFSTATQNHFNNLLLSIGLYVTAAAVPSPWLTSVTTRWCSFKSESLNAQPPEISFWEITQKMEKIVWFIFPD